MIKWTVSIDPVVESKIYSEQTYRSCVGILSFEKEIGRERLINACKRAAHFHTYNYKIIERILQSKHDLLPFEDEPVAQPILPLHENIRGSSYYKSKINNHLD